MRFGSNRGARHARADEHERAPPLQLREPGLHRFAVAGAFEHDVDRVVDDLPGSNGPGTSSASGATTTVAPKPASERLAHGRRLADLDVVDVHCPQRGDGERADRTGAEHQRALALVCTPEFVMPCNATARGSASAASRNVTPSGTRSNSRSSTFVYRANAPCQLATGARRVAFAAQRRMAAAAHLAPAATRRRTTDHRVADRPAGHRRSRPRPRRRSTRGRRSSPRRPHPSSTMCRSLPHTPQ